MGLTTISGLSPGGGLSAGGGLWAGGGSANQLVNSWVAAVIANGGTVSAGRQAIVRAFIEGEIADGSWALTDDYIQLCAENEVQALTSLKQLRLATLIAAPTFTIDRGYAFNGTTQAVNTGFIANTHGVRMTGSEVRIACYERTNVAANTAAVGSLSSGQIYIRPRSAAGAVVARASSAATTFADAVADSRGFTVVSKVGNSTTLRTWKNGVRGTDGTASSVSLSLPATALFIGAANSAGAVGVPRAATEGFIAMGAPLSDAQEAASYTRLQTWMTAIGANV